MNKTKNTRVVFFTSGHAKKSYSKQKKEKYNIIPTEKLQLLIPDITNMTSRLKTSWKKIMALPEKVVINKAGFGNKQFIFSDASPRNLKDL